MSPARYPKRVLLAAIGLTPQVLTETLYGLARPEEGEPWIPTEVRIITTSEGAERARLALLSPTQDWFGRLVRELGIADVRFDDTSFQVITGSDGELADIRTAADNLAAADQILEFVRKATADDTTSVHVSVAGGRKTMGFFLGYALSLYGRAQDRLSHVLVSAPYESHPGFYFPTTESAVIYTAPPDSRPLDVSKARVTLAYIPFVRLRTLLGEGGPLQFADAVAMAQQAVSDPELVIDLNRRTIRAGGVDLDLPAAEAAFLTMFARRVLSGSGPAECPREAGDISLAQEFLREYEFWSRSTERTQRALRDGMDRVFFLQRCARLKEVLRRRAGRSAEAYFVRATGRRPCSRYGLTLLVAKIRIEGDR